MTRCQTNKYYLNKGLISWICDICRDFLQTQLIERKSAIHLSVNYRNRRERSLLLWREYRYNITFGGILFGPGVSWGFPLTGVEVVYVIDLRIWGCFFGRMVGSEKRNMSVEVVGLCGLDWKRSDKIGNNCFLDEKKRRRWKVPVCSYYAYKGPKWRRKIRHCHGSSHYKAKVE